jgi:cytochrome P450
VLSEPTAFELDPGDHSTFDIAVRSAVHNALAKEGPRAAVERFATEIDPVEWASAPEDERERRRANQAALLRLMNSAPKLLTLRHLEGIKLPCIVVAGTQTHDVFRRIAAVLASTIPEARLVEFPGSGHQTYANQPEHFARVVREFTASVSASGDPVAHRRRIGVVREASTSAGRESATRARSSSPNDLDPLFDRGDPGMGLDPYPYYRRLREKKPIHWSQDGFWVLSRYADVAAVHRDRRFDRGLKPDDGVLARWGGAESPVTQELGRWMLLKDPPDHTRLRGLVRPAFKHATLRQLRARIQQTVDDLLDRVQDWGSMDVIAQLAYPLPVSVISDLLGLPIDDHEQCRGWAEAIGHVFHPIQTSDTLRRAGAAIDELSEYVRAQVVARRRQPHDDLLSLLIAAEEAGDRLTESELVSTVNLLLFAGHETTRNLIGNGLLALLRHPDELQRLYREPELISHAVDELLRYDSPVQSNRRVTREDVDIDGIRIAAGQLVLLLIGAAHRDPARYPNPDQLDVDRPDVRPLSFGGGVHHCLGAGLAQMETEIVLSSLLRRFKDLQLAIEEPQWRGNLTLRGLQALPIAFTCR